MAIKDWRKKIVDKYKIMWTNKKNNDTLFVQESEKNGKEGYMFQLFSTTKKYTEKFFIKKSDTIKYANKYMITH